MAGKDNAVASAAGGSYIYEFTVGQSGTYFYLTITMDGVTLNESARYQADTVNVGPSQRYDVIWTARKPGKWLVRCHIPHHTTNNNVVQDGGRGLMLLLDVK